MTHFIDIPLSIDVEIIKKALRDKNDNLNIELLSEAIHEYLNRSTLNVVCTVDSNYVSVEPYSLNNLTLIVDKDLLLCNGKIVKK